MTIKNKLEDNLLAEKQWYRYQSALTRGHQTYQSRAKLCEDFYLGGGRQWSESDKKALEDSGRPWLEENIIFSTINTVLGYQTQSRMDISYKPREVDDQDISDILAKISMYLIDQNKYPWKESQMFADGLIQQRGYIDLKMNFDENIYGDVEITNLDPLNVIPDPDSNSYDPDDWGDVIILDWMSHDDIKENYGITKWREVESYLEKEADFGRGSLEEQRNKFGGTNNQSSYYVDETDLAHSRIINRQYWKIHNREFFLDSETGDLFPVPDNMKPIEKKKVAKERRWEIIKKISKRIRWTVSTQAVVLHDAWSPYNHFTVIPYFPYFRRGITLGLVDNLIKTQEMLNKVRSQMLHVVNTTANSGWMIEESSLSNIETEDLEERGGETGLVLEYKQGRAAPAKIEPNQIPSGLKDMVTTSVELLRMISGVSETFQGGKGPEVSGVAIQSRVHQSAIQLATPIDNLFRTRNMLADRLLELIRSFYTQERTFMITGPNKDGGNTNTPVTINQQAEEDPSRLINDVTVGKYDVVIADVPTQITFQNAQFAQAIELKKYGVQIPDSEMILMSTLSRKNDIAKQVSGELSPEKQAEQQKQTDLTIETMQKTIAELEAKAESKEAETLKQIADVAVLISANPKLAPIIDALTKSIEKEDAEGNLKEEEPLQQNTQLGNI
jgi:hypothetical protein